MSEPRRPSHFRRRWTEEEEDDEFRRLLAAKRTVGQIARAMGRTQDAIRGRADALKLTVRSPTRPWRDGSPRRHREPDES